MENETKLIGDYLGTIEEFVPGVGTYAEEGKIYAANIGRVEIDRENHVVKVMGKMLPVLERGMVVFGEVLDIKKNAVVIIARKIQGQRGDVDIKVGLFVSNISDGYVERPDDLFAIGDIVKGVVIKMEGSLIDISTRGPYGVVKAFCRRCRCPMEKSDKVPADVLVCPCCADKEKRKIADDYGNVSDL
jgi:exosome complex component CSL4